MAALVFGLRHFRQYLLGRHFVVRVDHMALTYYRKCREPTGQHARYLDFIAEFDFDCQYREGRRHGNCDGLSRLSPCEIDSGEPCNQCNRRVNGRHVPADENADVCRVTTRASSKRQEGSTGMDGDASERGGASAAAPLVDPNRGRVETRLPRDAAAALTGRPSKSNSGKRRKRNMGLLGRTAPAAATAGIGDWNPAFLRDRQLQDPDIGQAMQWVEGDSGRPPWDAVASGSQFLRSLWQQYESLVLRDGALYRIFHDPNGMAQFYQYVLPADLKVPFLELIHNDAAGHLKFVKCVEHVTRRAWWSSWRRDLKLFIQCCTVCSAYHRGPTPRQSNLRPMVLGGPGERWSLDLTGPHPTSNGYKYLFTALCPFSKYGIAVPIRNKDASTVARALVDHVFLKWGLCFEILSDQGKEFEAELLTELLSILGVVKLRSSGYRPQTNGACESWHRTLNSLLAKVVSDSQHDWSSYVAYVVFCYNATPHSATGFAPHFIMTGQQPRWNVDFLLNNVCETQQTIPEYTSTVLMKLDHAFELTREHLRQNALSMSTWYNRKTKPRSFAQGDVVRVYNPRRFKGRSPKWQSFYRDTAVVERRLNDATYVVKSATWKKAKVVHVDKLKLDHRF